MTLETNISTSPHHKYADDIRCYHNTSSILYPGVGQYSIEKISIDLKPKSPKATMGTSSRFGPVNKL